MATLFIIDFQCLRIHLRVVIGGAGEVVMATRYFLGGPLSKVERERALDRIMSISDPAIRLNRIDDFINRVTEKTIGLLTTSAVVLATGFWIFDKHPGLLSGFPLVLGILAVFLLSTNLGTVWRKDQGDWDPTDKNFYVHVLNLFCDRAIKMQIALMMVCSAIACTFSLIVFEYFQL